jgi:tRNA(Leu) C34 or U34 (ribose-2'-O)-methylase TrmL
MLDDRIESYAARLEMVPVCVEVGENAESLDEFVHPERAVYIFGPEDGSVPKGVRTICHRFVRIPTATRTPLNLAAAVNVTLYDRYVKERRRNDSHPRELVSYQGGDPTW